MIEKNIRLTVEEHGNKWSHKSRFIISVSDSGVEIRHESEPVSARDRSAAVTVGTEPTFVDLVLHVEDALP